MDLFRCGYDCDLPVTDAIRVGNVEVAFCCIHVDDAILALTTFEISYSRRDLPITRFAPGMKVARLVGLVGYEKGIWCHIKTVSGELDNTITLENRDMRYYLNGWAQGPQDNSRIVLPEEVPSYVHVMREQP